MEKLEKRMLGLSNKVKLKLPLFYAMKAIDGGEWFHLPAS
jgi:hypothetical protein